MIRFSSSIVVCSSAVLAAVLVGACGGGNKTSSLGANPDASPTDDAGANGGSGNAGAGNGGNGGTNGMDATAPDASPSSTPDASPDASPTGSNDSGVVDSGANDGGYSDAGDAGPVCGNGDIEGTEGCDDGNDVSGDGCTADCWAVELTQTVTAGPGLALPITDNGYDGMLSSMACVNLLAGAWTGADISAVSVQVAITHGYVGDLVMKLVSPANTVVTLMSRPGFLETMDNGTEANFGDSSALAAGNPITFSQGASVSAEDMGNTIAALTVCASDLICSFIPNNGAAAAGNLDSFDGQTSPGTWQLCVGDVNAGDLGSIHSVTLTIDH